MRIIEVSQHAKDKVIKAVTEAMQENGITGHVTLQVSEDGGKERLFLVVDGNDLQLPPETKV